MNSYAPLSDPESQVVSTLEFANGTSFTALPRWMSTFKCHITSWAHFKLIFNSVLRWKSYKKNKTKIKLLYLDLPNNYLFNKEESFPFHLTTMFFQTNMKSSSRTSSKRVYVFDRRVTVCCWLFWKNADDLLLTQSHVTVYRHMCCCCCCCYLGLKNVSNDAKICRLGQKHTRNES